MTDPNRPDLPDRDPALDAAWKAHSTELPPPRVDAAILAAAHREARTRPQAVGDDDGAAHARSPSRAWWGLAAAATIGALAFGVLQLAPPMETDQSTTVTTDIPQKEAERAPADAARDAASLLADAQRRAGADTLPRAEAPAPAREDDRRTALARAPDPAPKTASRSNAQEVAKPKQGRADSAENKRESPVDSTVPAARALAEAPVAAAPPPAPPDDGKTTPRAFPGAAPAPSIAPAPASPSTPAEVAKSEAAANAGNVRRRESGERMAAMTPTQPAAEPARRAQADRAAQGAATAPMAKLQVRTPAAWIERVRMLHAEQRFDEAARELNAFRDAYPDADTRLPVALQAWAASVKRTENPTR
jgi:hypothetical protein